MADESGSGLPKGQKSCPKCRAIIPIVAKICATCGSSVPRSSEPDPAVQAMPSTKTCASCNSTVPVAAKICASCNSYFPREARPEAAPVYAIPEALPTRQPSSSDSPAGGLVAVAILVVLGFVGYKWYTAQNPAAAGRVSAPVSAESASTSAPTSGTFSGNIAALPQSAQDVLAFQPAESPIQTQSATIAARVEEACGDATSDYIGADDFPGSVAVEARPHGWTRVSWSLTCAGLGGGIVGKHPTAIFELSHDGQHLRDVNDAAQWLTH